MALNLGLNLGVEAGRGMCWQCHDKVQEFGFGIPFPMPTKYQRDMNYYTTPLFCVVRGSIVYDYYKLSEKYILF